MAAPILITDAMKRKIRDEFTKQLSELKTSAGVFNYSKSFRYDKASAVLWLTSLAYSKTVALVTTFSDEVAWHGTAVRKSKNEFIVEDIFVYPQEVTGGTVTTDQDLYTQWLYEFDDETFNGIRMQGHSHVNMGVSPSGIDDRHRDKILQQLEGDMFYVFMIWNKSLNVYTLIYDMANNILYEDDDIDVQDHRGRLYGRVSIRRERESTAKEAFRIWNEAGKRAGAASFNTRFDMGFFLCTEFV